MIESYRIMISGGGTGGHVYPALAIADEFKKQFPRSDIRFVGAKGRMEMEKVPLAGYQIEGLDIAGIQRKNLLKNISLPFKLLRSVRKVNRMLKDFRPHAVVGVGGYASGPLLYLASGKGIPTLIQEQNSFPGITNKILSKRARKICVAYPGMEKFFPAGKIVMTGNPVRNFKAPKEDERIEAYKYFNLKPGRPTLLVLGGSLGSKTINQAIKEGLSKLEEARIQVIWQTGKNYYHSIIESVTPNPRVNITAFIDRMDLAYSASDVVISRAGAISISELSLVGKPVILIPSPNVAEDHQTKNAKVLADAKASIMIKDNEAIGRAVDEAIMLISDISKQKELADNIGKFARPDAAKEIVYELVELINGNAKRV